MNALTALRITNDWIEGWEPPYDSRRFRRLGEDDAVVLGEAQLERAWRLANAHGHEWALGDYPQSVMMVECPDGRRVSVREALRDENADQISTWSAIRAAGESALPTIGEIRTATNAVRGMSLPGISAPRTMTVAGVTVIAHTTGTGRLSWEVWPNGRVDIAITRPSPIGLPIGVEVLHLTVEDVAGDTDRDGLPSRFHPAISRVDYVTSDRPWKGCQARHLAVATRCLEALGFSAYQIAVKLAPAIVAGANAADASPEGEEYVGNFLAGLRGREVMWRGRPARLFAATTEMAERLMTDPAAVAEEGGVVVVRSGGWSAASEMDKSLYPGQFLAGVVLYKKEVVPAEWRRDNANEVFDGDFGGRQATVYTQWGYRDAIAAKQPQLQLHQVVVVLAPGQSDNEPVYIDGDDYIVAVVKYEE